MGHLRHNVGKLEHLRAQRLLPREGKKLSSQARGAVRIRLDLLDIVIVAVARRVPHQHQVAVADDRGQDVVEVVRDAAGELADRLHLGRLRDLALELGFLAIVLEQQQHRRVAKAAKPGDGQRDRLRRMPREPDGKVARHRRPARIAANRVGDGRLVFLDDQVAGIDRHRIAPDPGGLAERLVHRQEAAVAIDQREADRQHFEQRLEVRRSARRRPIGAVEQTGTLPVAAGSPPDRAEHGPPEARRPASPSASKLEMPVLADSTRSVKRGSFARRRPGKRASREQAVRGEHRPLRSTKAASTPGAASRSPVVRRMRLDRDGQRIGRGGLGSATGADRLRGPTRSTSTGLVPAAVAIAGDAAGAIAPRHRLGELAAPARFVVGRELERRPRASEPLAIGGIDEQQRALARRQRAGSCSAPSADADAAHNPGRRPAARSGASSVRPLVSDCAAATRHDDRCDRARTSWPAEQQQTAPRLRKAAPPISAGAASGPSRRGGRVDRRQLLVQHARSMLRALILPDAHAVRRREVQLLPGLNVERRVPRVHVADDARALFRTANADRSAAAGEGWPRDSCAATPAPSRGRSAGRRSCPSITGGALPPSECDVGVVRDRQAGKVGDVLAHRQLAVDVHAGQRLVGVVLLLELVEARLERLHVLRRPPVDQAAVLSYFAPWSSKWWLISWPITAPMPP